MKVGDGRAGEGELNIPEGMRLEEESISCLVDTIFPDIEQRYTDTKWLPHRAILSPSNKEVEEINAEVLSRLPGEETIMKSIDSTEENTPEYPPEFLNSLEMSGMPPHLLKLKPGCIVVLLRNMDPENGHCNGVKYCVVNILPHILELRSVSDTNRGAVLLLPRITSISRTKSIPFALRRKQFPIKLAFALTANKVLQKNKPMISTFLLQAQGQTLEAAGIYLGTEFFSHGQCYVAFSRVGNPDNIKEIMTTLLLIHWC